MFSKKIYFLSFCFVIFFRASLFSWEVSFGISYKPFSTFLNQSTSLDKNFLENNSFANQTLIFVNPVSTPPNPFQTTTRTNLAAFFTPQNIELFVSLSKKIFPHLKVLVQTTFSRIYDERKSTGNFLRLDSKDSNTYQQWLSFHKRENLLLENTSLLVGLEQFFPFLFFSEFFVQETIGLFFPISFVENASILLENYQNNVSTLTNTLPSGSETVFTREYEITQKSHHIFNVFYSARLKSGMRFFLSQQIRAEIFLGLENILLVLNEKIIETTTSVRTIATTETVDPTGKKISVGGILSEDRSSNKTNVKQPNPFSWLIFYEIGCSISYLF